MIYLGDQAVGINHTNIINWNKLAIGELNLAENVILDNNITQIVDNGLRGLGMTNIEGANVITIGKSALQYTNNLNKAIFMNAETLKDYCMADSSVKYVILPKATTIYGDILYRSTKLLGLDLGNKNIISDFNGMRYAFDHNSAAVTILRYGYVIPADNGWFYNNCWLKSTTVPGQLYVWQNLIQGYREHSVWGPILEQNNNQILPIEGSIYEAQYVDGTSII